MAQAWTPTVPKDGKPITVAAGTLTVPDHPIIPFIEGDGTGPDIWRAAKRVLEAAVEQAYKGKRKIAWPPRPSRPCRASAPAAARPAPRSGPGQGNPQAMFWAKANWSPPFSGW